MGDRGSSSERQAWIDVARGIGIVAVVAGHVWTRGAFRDAVYSFHMPLFFLLSGLLAKPQPVGAFAWRQLGSQMRPYAAFLALLILVDQVIEPMKGGRSIFHDWPADLWPVLFGGTELRGPYTIFWFVPCLMVARILFNVALVQWQAPLRWPMTLFALGMMVAGYAMGMITNVSPLGLLTVPMAIFLLWAGAAWHGVVWRAWTLVPLIALALPGLATFLPTLNMKVGDYSVPVLSIASAIATSLLAFQLSRAIAPRAAWLATLGRASLVIMYLHVAVVHYLSPYMSKPVLLGLALLGPLAVWWLMRSWSVTRRIFL
jgi:fucose 4-O-acetylase-like acetyltransferase